MSAKIRFGTTPFAGFDSLTAILLSIAADWRVKLAVDPVVVCMTKALHRFWYPSEQLSLLHKNGADQRWFTSVAVRSWILCCSVRLV